MNWSCLPYSQYRWSNFLSYAINQLKLTFDIISTALTCNLEFCLLPSRRTAQKDLGIVHRLTSFEIRHVSHARMGDHLTGDGAFEFLAGMGNFDKNILRIFLPLSPPK